MKIWMIIISIKNSDNNLFFLDALLDDCSKFHRNQRFVPSIEILKSYVNFQLSGHTLGRLWQLYNFFVEVRSNLLIRVFFMVWVDKKRYKMSFCTLSIQVIKRQILGLKCTFLGQSTFNCWWEGRTSMFTVLGKNLWSTPICTHYSISLVKLFRCYLNSNSCSDLTANCITWFGCSCKKKGLTSCCLAEPWLGLGLTFVRDLVKYPKKTGKRLLFFMLNDFFSIHWG